jgi:hypothetical protein
MGALFGTFALSLWYGAEVVGKGQCGLAEVMASLLCMIFGGIRAGAFLGEAPDPGPGRRAAVRVPLLCLRFFGGFFLCDSFARRLCMYVCVCGLHWLPP